MGQEFKLGCGGLHRIGNSEVRHEEGLILGDSIGSLVIDGGYQSDWQGVGGVVRARGGQQGLGLVREEAPPLQRTLTRRCPAALAADAGESRVAGGRALEEKRRDVHPGLVAPLGARFSVGALDGRPRSGCVHGVQCSAEVSQPATCLPSGMHPLGYRLQSSDGVRGALLRARGGKPCHISPWVVDKAANCAFGKVVRREPAVLPQGCHFCGWDLKGPPYIGALESQDLRILGF
ncbi:hypothetical protein LEMLEM_LOCUS19483 [Lemmus lemmus]